MQIDDNTPWKQPVHSEGKPSSFYSHKTSTEGVHWKKQARFCSDYISANVSLSPWRSCVHKLSQQMLCMSKNCIDSIFQTVRVRGQFRITITHSFMLFILHHQISRQNKKKTYKKERRLFFSLLVVINLGLFIRCIYHRNPIKQDWE